MSTFSKEELYKNLYSKAESTEESIVRLKSVDKEIGNLIEESTSTHMLDIYRESRELYTDEVMQNVSKLAEEIESVATLTSTTSAVAFEEFETSYNEHQHQRIMQTCIFSQSVDLCFVFDATGSMTKYFKALKANIRKIVYDMKRANPNMEIRMSMVIYRDPEDGEGHIQIHQFSDSLKRFVKFLENVTVDGGSDECEDVIEALNTASNLKWENANRILILCGDAPCHGIQYHDGAGDNHPYGLGKNSETILHRLIENNIEFKFLKINKTTDKMIRVFNEEASRSPVQGLLPSCRNRQEYIATARMDKNNIQKCMLESLMTSITESLSISQTNAESLIPKTITGVSILLRDKFSPSLPVHFEETNGPVLDDDFLSIDGVSPP